VIEENPRKLLLEIFVVFLLNNPVCEFRGLAVIESCGAYEMVGRFGASSSCPFMSGTNTPGAPLNLELTAAATLE